MTDSRVILWSFKKLFTTEKKHTKTRSCPRNKWFCTPNLKNWLRACFMTANTFKILAF